MALYYVVPQRPKGKRSAVITWEHQKKKNQHVTGKHRNANFVKKSPRSKI